MCVLNRGEGRGLSEGLGADCSYDPPVSAYSFYSNPGRTTAFKVRGLPLVLVAK